MPPAGLKLRCAHCGCHAKPCYQLHDTRLELCRTCYFEILEIEEKREGRGYMYVPLSKSVFHQSVD
jgi:hypothetical protein